jgi:hypothetical protein
MYGVCGIIQKYCAHELNTAFTKASSNRLPHSTILPIGTTIIHSTHSIIQKMSTTQHMAMKERYR